MILTLEHASLVGAELALLFADGVEVYLPCPLLRRACPCAVCQGEPDALGRVLRPTVSYGPRAFELDRFEGVGGYAVQLFWADGHSSGIYSYGYLKKLAELPSE
ncbi:MAG: gamma-butyrobetaine hydroxylase-like domain-containing protein [Luteolibacter sp.]